MDSGLDGQVALITGGASGIGRATALRLAADGARVVVADRDRGAGEQVLAPIADAGGSARFVETDITDPASVNAAVASAVAAFGRPDCAHDFVAGGRDFGGGEG